RFFRETKSLYKKSVKVAKIDALSDPVLEMLALSTVSIALLAGSYLVLNHSIFLDLGLLKLQLADRPMAIEDLLYLYAMLAGISDPVRKLANVHSRIQRAAAASDRICALMDRRPQVADKPKAVRLARHGRSIEFDSVVFGYNGREPVIRGVSQFVSGLPGGYDTLIGERGLGLSGGQRQRIALARAMLRDPAVLILDEATSAVDIQDEALIRKAIEEFARDRTTFLITHSLGALQ